MGHFPRLPPSDSAIATVERPGAAEPLAHAGVRASVRAGCVPPGCHLPAGAADVDRAVAALT